MSKHETTHSNNSEKLTNETALRMADLLHYVGWQELIAGVELDPDSTPQEAIYPLPERFVGTGDDIAIVVYNGVEEAENPPKNGAEHPHKHVGGETEIHVGAEGKSTYYVAGEPEPMGSGSSLTIETGIPHFSANEQGRYVAAVISSPNFNPDNISDLDPAIPQDAATLAAYERVTAA